MLWTKNTQFLSFAVFDRLKSSYTIFFNQQAFSIKQSDSVYIHVYKFTKRLNQLANY